MARRDDSNRFVVSVTMFNRHEASAVGWLVLAGAVGWFVGVWMGSRFSE